MMLIQIVNNNNNNNNNKYKIPKNHNTNKEEGWHQDKFELN